MALLGGRDTRDITLFTGVDATELAKFALLDGTTLDVVAGELDGALTALNSELNSDPFYSGLCYVTDNPQVSYRMGDASTGFGDYDEYTKPDPQRAEVDGHMLPIKARDMQLRWTWDYLRRADMSKIEADIVVAVTAARDARRKAVLNRLLKRGDDSGKSNGLGAGGYSPGFATAAANTNVDFTPPAFQGKTFASSHDHYVFAAASITSAQAIVMMKTLREHGHLGPYELLISETDESTVRAFTDFVKATDQIVQLGANTATVNLAAGYIGYLTESYSRVRIVNGWPANYMSMYKSYGSNSQLNPLRVRVQKGESAFRVQAFPDPRSGGVSPMNPLGSLMLFTEFGVGVGDRTAGTTNRSNAAWADGTAS